VRASTEHLARKGIEQPRLDAELLLGRAFGLTRLELYTQHDRPLGAAETDAGRALVARRGRREPLAHVLGDWGFIRLVLRTDARALVPRPETEIVVERCLELLEGVEAPRIADVGTGTGAIALAVKDERRDAVVLATDVSAEALALARENAAALGLEVAFAHTSLLEGVEGPFDLVVSNPPYVRADELDGLEPEVRDFEPRLALVEAGQTEALARTARAVLAGPLVLEIHEDEGPARRVLLESLGYEDVVVSRDLTGRERVVEGRWIPR
jgi:release factor glutamine methyltransferase